ncbi:MAG: hypothetical protein ABIG61_17855 [Planctomycetota bacterium]
MMWRFVILMVLLLFLAMGCRAGVGVGTSAVAEGFYPDNWKQGGDPYRSRQAASATKTATENRPGTALPMIGE